MGNRTCRRCGHGNLAVAEYCAQCGVAFADDPPAGEGWSRIRKGMSADEVRRLLGEPPVILCGFTGIKWRYTNEGAGMFGPQVVFGTSSHTVKNWRLPQHKAARSDPRPTPPPALRVQRGSDTRTTFGKRGNAKDLYLDYWTAFRRLVDSRNTIIRMNKPRAGQWMNFMKSSDSTWLSAGPAMTKQRLTVLLVIGGDKRVAYLNLLKQDRGPIEQEIGHALEWQEKQGNKECFVCLDLPGTRIDDRTDWPRQHELLLDLLERFHRAFAPRVKQKGIT